jgi:hypothetical protein
MLSPASTEIVSPKKEARNTKFVTSVVMPAKSICNIKKSIKKPKNLRSTLIDFCNILTAQIMGNKKKAILLTSPHIPERTALVRISL